MSNWFEQHRNRSAEAPFSCHLMAYSDPAFSRMIGDVMLVSPDLAFGAESAEGTALSGNVFATFIMDSSYADTVDQRFRFNFDTHPNVSYAVIAPEVRTVAGEHASVITDA